MLWLHVQPMVSRDIVSMNLNLSMLRLQRVVLKKQAGKRAGKKAAVVFDDGGAERPTAISHYC